MDSNAFRSVEAGQDETVTYTHCPADNFFEQISFFHILNNAHINVAEASFVFAIMPFCSCMQHMLTLFELGLKKVLM